MAGPSVLVRILGDFKQFASSASDAGKSAEGVASRAHSAFSGLLGTLNRTGVLGPFGEVLTGIDEAFGSILEHGKEIGPAMIGVGAAVAGVGAALSLAGSKDKAAHQQLQAAVEATGASYDDYSDKIEAAIKHQEKYGNTANQTQDALRALTEATHDPAKALDLLSTATDLAAAKHEDLTTAAGQVGKVYNGNTKLLKEFGVNIDKTTGKTKDNQTATQALSGVLAGQASAATNTFAGRLDAVKARLEDGVATLGQKYGPALQTAGVAITALGAVWTTIGPVIAAMELSTLGPILLIVAGIAVLLAAAYLIYRNWSTIWAGMQAAVQAVWNWIKTNWPLLLAILLGPIGIAVGLIIRYWSQITGALAAAMTWIRTNWPLILAVLTGPIGIAVLMIARNWQAIKDGAAAAVDWIKSTFDGLVSWFAGLGGRISGAVSGMFEGMWHAFASVVNRIIDGWNSLHFSIPSIDTHIPGVGKVGGESVGVPQIPHLAQGGVITADGLVYAHAGEAITPAGRVGPAIQIGAVNLGDGVDIDLFMRKAAWVVRTRGV